MENHRFSWFFRFAIGEDSARKGQKRGQKGVKEGSVLAPKRAKIDPT